MVSLLPKTLLFSGESNCFQWARNLCYYFPGLRQKDKGLEALFFGQGFVSFFKKGSKFSNGLLYQGQNFFLESSYFGKHGSGDPSNRIFLGEF